MLDATLLLLQQSHKWLSKMLIEHISGSYRRQTINRKNVMVRYGGQQDASTSKVSLVNQPRMCHNSPPISNRVNPSQLQKSQRCPEKSTQGSKLKVNAAADWSTI